MNFTAVKLEATEGVSLDVLDVRQTLPRHDTRKWHQRALRDISYMVWHHAAGELSVDRVAAYHIGPNHISENGCPAICYHFFVGNDGTIYWCNDFEAITWSNGVKEFNNQGLAVCFEGDLTKREPTPAQMKAALDLFNWSDSYFKHVLKKTLQLFGHKEVKAGTACPGNFLHTLVSALRSYIDPIEIETESEGELMTLIEAYQTILTKLDLYTGKVDNDFGPKSKAATSAFQRKRKLDVTGTVNAQTTEMLLRVSVTLQD